MFGFFFGLNQHNVWKFLTCLSIYPMRVVLFGSSALCFPCHEFGPIIRPHSSTDWKSHQTSIAGYPRGSRLTGAGQGGACDDKVSVRMAFYWYRWFCSTPQSPPEINMITSIHISQLNAYTYSALARASCERTKEDFFPRVFSHSHPNRLPPCSASLERWTNIIIQIFYRWQGVINGSHDSLVSLQEHI